MTNKLNINLDTSQNGQDTIHDMMKFMHKLSKSGAKSSIIEQMPKGCEVTVLRSTNARFIIIRTTKIGCKND